MTKRKLLLAAIIAIILLALSLVLQIWVKKHRAESSSAYPATNIPSPHQTAASTPAKAAQVALPSVKPAVPNPNAPDNSAPAATAGAEPSADAKNRVSSIARAYLAYLSADENSRFPAANPGDTAHALALELARRSGVNNANIYFVPGDPKVPSSHPSAVSLGGTGDNAEMNPAFANATLSIVLVANLPAIAEPSITPIAWTRGLRDDGTWAPDSPFGGKGGYVAFADGHVEWVTSFSTTDPKGAYFVKSGTTSPTTNVAEALPPGALALSAEPAPAANK